MTRRTPAPRVLHPDAAGALDALVRHRLLTTAQVHALVMPGKQERWAGNVLRKDLLARGFVATVRLQTGPIRQPLWYATPAGVETALGAPVPGTRRYQMTATKAVGPAAQHLLAVNDVGVQLARWARPKDHTFDTHSWEHEVSLETGRTGVRRYVQADALLTYLAETDGGQRHYVQRFLEVDRGTMQPHNVAAKVGAYAAAERHGAWRDRYPAFPHVLYVFCPGGRTSPERQLELVFDLLSARPRQPVGVWLTTLDRLRDLGPFARICDRPDATGPVPLLAFDP